MKRSIAVFFAFAVLRCALPAAAQEMPATAAGISADEAAAARRVMMHALQGGNQGGCYPLPSGWSSVSATVNFPASYGGYGEWVNNAELLPVSDNLSAFLGSHSPGHFVQTAVGTGTSVRTTLCAPAGFTYWLVVDSGTAKVAIRKVTLSQPGRAYKLSAEAPPLGSHPEDTPATQTSSGQSSSLDQLLRSWTVQIPALGMSAVEITPQLLNVLHARPDMRGVRGIVIVSLAPGGWASSRGFHQYDIVTAIDNRPFETISQFERYLGAFGNSPQFSILRDKQHLVLSGGYGQHSGWRPPVTGPGYTPPGAASTPCPC
jgi:hypothetical protein